MKLKLSMTALLYLLMVNFSHAEPATDKSIRQLMDLTGAGNLGVQLMQSMMASMKKARPNIPESFWHEFMKEVNPNDLINQVIPIYQKYYAEEDIRAAINFYSSPAGKRLISMQPIILQESMLAGQQWGRSIAMRAMEKAKQLEANTTGSK